MLGMIYENKVLVRGLILVYVRILIIHFFSMQKLVSVPMTTKGAYPNPI